MENVEKTKPLLPKQRRLLRSRRNNPDVTSAKVAPTEEAADATVAKETGEKTTVLSKSW